MNLKILIAAFVAMMALTQNAAAKPTVAVPAINLQDATDEEMRRTPEGMPPGDMYGLDIIDYFGLARIDMAARGCIMAILNDKQVAAETARKPAESESLPACAAHLSMVKIYWEAQTEFLKSYVATDLATTAKDRDAALLEAAKAANALATEVAVGKQDGAVADNTLATEVTKGELAAANADNALAGVKAQGQDAAAQPAANAANGAKLVVIQTALVGLKEAVAALGAKIDEEATIHQNICAKNKGVSWCPTN